MNKKLHYLLIGSNLWWLGEGMFGPLLAVFTEHIGGDILEISWAWAIYLLVTGILMIYFGKLSDNISKEKLMIYGYMLNTLCTFLYLAVKTPMHLFIVQAGLGVANALATPTWNALYAQNETKKNAGYLWGLADGEGTIITGIAIIIGGIILHLFSFEILFMIMGSIQLIATIYQAKIKN